MEQEFDNFTKTGFARLLRIFENTDDVVKLTRAFSLARRAHKDEMWNKTEQYVHHPLRVSLILAEELQNHDLELACAALLHDVSDPAYSPELDEFGPRVSGIASVSSLERKMRSESSAEKYFEQLSKASKDARIVKIADALDVARGMKNQGFLEKAKRFKEETQRYLIPIAERTDDKIAFKLSVALYELK